MTMPDMLITPDFSQSADETGEGNYKVRITGHKFNPEAYTYTSKKTGQPITVAVITWTLETFGEEQAKNNGRIITHRTAINGEFPDSFRKFFKAATGEGYPDGHGFDPATLYGREIEVVYGPQKNKPEYMEVKAVRSIK